MNFRWKLFVTYICLLIPALLIFYFWTETWLQDTYLDVVRKELEREVKILSKLLDVNSQDIDEQVDSVVRDSGRRLTVIVADGKVMADSSFSGIDLEDMDNHGMRPEVVEARSQGLGSSLRFSNSVTKQMFYVAFFVADQDVFIRISTSVENIELVAADLRRVLAGHTLILILVGVFLSFLLSKQFSRPLGELAQSARSVAQGDFSNPFRVKGTDEIARLGQTLFGMAQKIQRQFTELESERNHLQAVLKSMDEGVMVTDQKGKITLANPALNQIFKLKTDPVRKNLLEVFRNVEVESGIKDVLENGEITQCEIETNDQCLRSVFAPIWVGENVMGVVTVFHDLSELRRLERARRDFVSNVSHEIRTPLTSISGYSETLINKGDLDEIQSRFLEKIYLNSVHLEEIVNDLLELSRIENKDLVFPYESLNMETLEKELREEVGEKLLKKKIKLVFQKDDFSRETFRLPKSHIMRILRNLLDNAIKYTKDGRIKVCLKRQNKDLMFSVSDTGIGIAEQDIDRVFERFYRGVQARSESLPGTGLGLSIVKHAVEQLGGSVSMESKFKQGTTVYFTIPQ